MKERLVEDWLIRINERGYDVAFCQLLVARGERILRCGHSSIEHGKDVLTSSPDGKTVRAYQLKTGSLSLAEISKLHVQLAMLVETRPSFPGLNPDFSYKPYLVTTGELKDPAISFLNERNAEWRNRKLPELEVVTGPMLLADLLRLSGDFWPDGAEIQREMRALYLADGNGDFDPEAFSKFVLSMAEGAKSERETMRRSAAINIYGNYLLGEFYRTGDHWSILRGWTICAATIAWASEKSGTDATFERRQSFDLALSGAREALRALVSEGFAEGGLGSTGFELDDYARVRNTTVLAAGACYLLTVPPGTAGTETIAARIMSLIQRDRVMLWGEGALSQFVLLIWALEQSGFPQEGASLLRSCRQTVSQRNCLSSNNPLPDAYVSADDSLLRTISDVAEREELSLVESFSLLPLIVLSVRRGLRTELEGEWDRISLVRMTWFRAEMREDVLRWTCDTGTEFSDQMAQPQSWNELQPLSWEANEDRLPPVFRRSREFALLFFLVFQHRMMPSLIKHLDVGKTPPPMAQAHHA